jgi:branched-chain amino acid transport system permease protein
LNLLVGYTGLFSFAHAAFYGIGAYITTLLMIKAGWGFFPALFIAILGAILLSLIVAIPSLRLKGDYFVLATLGFQTIIFYILYNWVGLTNGPYGIPGIPRPKFLGFMVDSTFAYSVFSILLSGICLLFLWRICESPFGRTLRAIRDDEIAASALGKNIYRFKVLAFVLSGAFASVPGALFASYMRYIDPTSFTLMETVFILSAVLIGGAGNIKGPIIGTVFVILLPEFLRFLHIPDTIAPNVRQILYGLFILILMRLRPQGLGGEYKLQ